MIRTASSGRRERGSERKTTGVPAPLISLGSRLLFLSWWSRETGLAVVVAKGPSTKRPSLRSGAILGAGLAEGKSWMPDEDSNLD